ncbi:MAG TPA: hypothetical protein VGK13_06855 [Methanocellaceae archaeon]|jgi:hypothetical protein
MISGLSKIGLTIVLVASLILMCGCTGSQVAATASPTPAGTQQDTTNLQTPTPTGSPTKNPTPAPTTEPSYTPTPVSTDQKPSVVSAKTDKDTYTNDNEKVTLTIISSSDSKVTGYSLSLDGPDGNVMKGPAQIEATYLGNNQWENDVMFITDNTLTPGTYTWSRIQAINNGGLWSDYGPSASFKVTSA